VIRKRIVKRRQPNISVTANYQIRVTEVRVLDERGEMVGVMPTSEALQRARELEKDLVLVTEKSNPPVAKIIDLAKYKYQQQQRDADNRKKARTVDIKEVQFSPFIGEGDLQTKLRRVHEFLGRGDKVRLVVDFKRGRAITKKEFGFEILNQIFAATAEEASVEMAPSWQGKKLITQLSPGKKSKPTPAAPAAQAATTEVEGEVHNAENQTQNS
jgi:translation initiation factor IF-3